MSDKITRTLCNIENLCSTCIGYSEGLTLEQMREQCDACVKSTYFDRCMHLCSDGRCDSTRAREAADPKKGG